MVEFEFVVLGLGLDVIGRGLSSSGLNEDNDDPVEDPLTCLDNPDQICQLHFQNIYECKVWPIEQSIKKFGVTFRIKTAQFTCL